MHATLPCDYSFVFVSDFLVSSTYTPRPFLSLLDARIQAPVGDFFVLGQNSFFPLPLDEGLFLLGVE